MPKRTSQPKKLPYRKVSEKDFNEHVIGRRARRRQKFRKALRFGVTGALLAAALAGGFAAMEALLQVSETPLPAEQVTTAPGSTTEDLAPRPEPEGEPMRSFYVPINMLDRREQSRALMRQAETQGANTAVMPFKDGNGYLTYRSNLMQQSLLRSNEKARYRTDWTLYDLKKRAEQRIVAVIHCFDDPLAADRMAEAAVLLRDTGNAAWKDAEGRRWLNPFSEAAREYLLAVIREVAAFGPDQRYRADDILLCGVRFPDGNLQSAAFPGSETPDDPEARNRALRGFIEEAKDAAGETANLYVMISAQDAGGGAEALGGDLWDSAADFIAVDVRGASWSKNDKLWSTRPAIPVVASPEDTKNARDYIVLEEDAQG